MKIIKLNLAEHSVEEPFVLEAQTWRRPSDVPKGLLHINAGAVETCYYAPRGTFTDGIGTHLQLAGRSIVNSEARDIKPVRNMDIAFGGNGERKVVMLYHYPISDDRDCFYVYTSERKG